MKLTVRARLTLLYGMTFLLTGSLLIALSYTLVRRGIQDRLPRVMVRGTLGSGFPSPPPGTRTPNPDEERRLRQAVIQVEREVRDRALHELLLQSLLALCVTSVGSIGLGYVVAGRALRPLQDITDAARRLGEQNLHERIGLTGPDDELKELADTFDEMLGRLDRAFESQRRFVANASHELRTPLTVARAEIDVTLADPDATSAQLRSMAATVRDAVDRTAQLVDSLLLLARSDRGVADREPVDLAELTGEVVTQAAAELRRTGVTTRLRLEPAPIKGDPALIDRLVTNLVENATRYNVPGGWVEVTTGVVDRDARLVVANSGPVVPPEEAERLFEPFRRGEVARTAAPGGAGLGLSIVRSVAEAHGGSAVARARGEGGLEVEIRFARSR